MSRTKKKVPLRVDSKTVIYVTPDKANEKYAEEWRQRHNADVRHSVCYETVSKDETMPATKGGKEKC